MSLRTFETDDAVYYLGLGNHTTSSKPLFDDVNLSKLDFMVFEDCGVTRGLEYMVDNNVQYKDLYKKLRFENPYIKTYGVDVDCGFIRALLGTTAFDILPTIGGFKLVYDAHKEFKKHKEKKKKMSRRKFLKTLGLGLTGAYLASTLPTTAGVMANSTSKKQMVPLAEQIQGIRSSVMPSEVLAFRDAVTAKKISEYLVPKHKSNYGKVHCGILYGSLHSGIELKIKQPWIADATIGIYYNLLRTQTKNKINEVREVGPLIYTTLCYDSKLF